MGRTPLEKKYQKLFPLHSTTNYYPRDYLLKKHNNNHDNLQSYTNYEFNLIIQINSSKKYVEAFLSEWPKPTDNILHCVKYKINRNSTCNINLNS